MKKFLGIIGMVTAGLATGWAQPFGKETFFSTADLVQSTPTQFKSETTYKHSVSYELGSSVAVVTAPRTYTAATTAYVAAPVIHHRVLGSYVRVPAVVPQVRTYNAVRVVPSSPFGQCGSLVTTTANTQNLRSGPSASMSRVGAFNHGEGLFVQQCRGGWCSLTDAYGQQAGYASQAFLACPGHAAEMRAAAAARKAAAHPAPHIHASPAPASVDPETADMVSVMRQAMELSDAMDGQMSSVQQQRAALLNRERRLQLLKGLVDMTLQGQNDVDLLMGMLGEK